MRSGSVSREEVPGLLFDVWKDTSTQNSADVDQNVQRENQGLTRRKRGDNLKRIIEELSTYMRGWLNYFGFCQIPTVFQDLQKWVWRKICCIIWKRWKRSSTRYERLWKMGALHAKEGAGNGSRGPWRMSASSPRQAASPYADCHVQIFMTFRSIETFNVWLTSAVFLGASNSMLN